MSAFMVPDYDRGVFVITADGAVPADCYCAGDHGDAEGVERGWFWRLSAPGYMDCTDWCGPFDTLEDAKADCRDTYDIDPDTGEDLPDED